MKTYAFLAVLAAIILQQSFAQSGKPNGSESPAAPAVEAPVAEAPPGSPAINNDAPSAGPSASSPQVPRAGLDVNDVAVLFPLDAANKPFPNIPLAEPLVSLTLFNQVLAAANTLGLKAPVGTASISNPSDWAVMAFRYDPCSPRDHAAPADPDCVPELRLVLQPSDSFGPSDSALHLIYSLGDTVPAAQDEAIKDLFDLKTKAEVLTQTKSSGSPLGVNPLLLAALKDSKAEAAVLFENFVKKYALSAQLKKITMMGLSGGNQTHWVFFGGNVVGDQWGSETIPSITESSLNFVELNLNSDKIFFPVPNEIMTTTFGFFHREVLVDDQYDTLKVGLHSLADAGVTNRNTSDCLSCHSATSIQTNANTRALPYIEGTTAKAPKGITAYPAPTLLQKHRFHWNMRALGYFGTLPTLSLHSVNEAGRSADRTNQIAARVNPGRDCSKVQSEVISCFVNTSAKPTAVVPSAESCLAVCAAAPEFAAP